MPNIWGQEMDDLILFVVTFGYKINPAAEPLLQMCMEDFRSILLMSVAVMKATWPIPIHTHHTNTLGGPN